jgi:hypothetical protein
MGKKKAAKKKRKTAMDLHKEILKKAASKK